MSLRVKLIAALAFCLAAFWASQAAVLLILSIHSDGAGLGIPGCLAASALVGVVFTCAILFFFDRLLLSLFFDPLSRICSHIRRMRLDSKLDPVDWIVWRDEVGVMADEFNQLMERIKGDLGDLFKARMDLHESEQKFGALFYDSPVGIIFADAAWNGRAANHVAIELLGLQGAAAMKLFNLKADPNFPATALADASLGHTVVIEFPYDFDKVKEKGLYTTSRIDTPTFELKISPVSFSRTPGRKPDFFVLILQDVTVRKAKDRKIRELMTKALESDRLKMTFMSIMSHEIRTPLSAIAGFAELLDSDSSPLDERREAVQIIKSNVERLMILMRNMLDIAKIDSGISESHVFDVSLAEMVEALLISYKRHAATCGKPGIEFHAEIPESPFIIRTDGVQLRRILENLLDNAVKFTLSGSIDFGFHSEADSNVLIFVNDTGVGIPKEKIHFVFDYFRQADESLSRRFEGAGLGLTFSSKAAEMLGGKISIDSEEGKGTRVRFTLPRVPPAAKNDLELSKPQPDPPSST